MPAPVVQTVDEGAISTQDQARTTGFEISDSSAADQEDGQDGESDKDEDNEGVDMGQGEEIDDFQANPPENPSEVRESETTPRIENEGAGQSTNADPPDHLSMTKTLRGSRLKMLRNDCVVPFELKLSSFSVF